LAFFGFFLVFFGVFVSGVVFSVFGVFRFCF